MSELPSNEQQQRARELLLRDMERRAERVILLKGYEAWWLVVLGLAMGAVLIVVGIVLGHWIFG